MSFYFPVKNSFLKCQTRAHTSLRLLGPLERQIVMNLLWLESAVPVSTMGAWVVREHQKWVKYPRRHRKFLSLCLQDLRGRIGNARKITYRPYIHGKFGCTSDIQDELTTGPNRGVSRNVVVSASSATLTSTGARKGVLGYQPNQMASSSRQMWESSMGTRSSGGR